MRFMVRAQFLSPFLAPYRRCWEMLISRLPTRFGDRWVRLSFVVLLAACQREPTPIAMRETVSDLVRTFPSATVNRPTQIIDMGRAEARRYLVSGWHGQPRELDGDRLDTWSVGDRSELEFFVIQPEDRTVSLRCAAVGRNTEQPRAVGLSVNGREWERIEIASSMKEYELVLPGKLLQRGLNRLSIENPVAARVQRSPSQDLRVLWDHVDLGLRDSSGSSEPFARRDKDTLFIPFGTRVDYYLFWPPRARLSASAVRGRGSAAGRLVVTWEPEVGQGTVLTEDMSAVPDFEVSNPRGGAARGRLSLLALSGSVVDPERPAGMLLESPRILAEDEGSNDPSEPQAVRPQRVDLANRPNIIVYLVDTLRADRLGVYGYPKDVSPVVDGLASEGILFANAQAQSPWTRASVASLFTGLWPQVHGARDDEDKLVDEALTLAERLRELGYHTAGITGNGNAHGPFGFSQGFDYFRYLAKIRPGDPLATSEDIHEAVVSWMDLHASDQPFFLYVHTIDPHAPYDPPERHRRRWAPTVSDKSIGTVEALGELGQLDQAEAEQRARDLLALYDAEVAYNDESFGRLLDELRSRSLFDDSLVVFLSDHGEEFFDHGGWTHGKTLYSEMLDVPMIIKLPGGQGAGQEVGEVVEHIDLVPTVMELVTGQIPAGVQGRSLLPLIMNDVASQGPQDWAVSNVALRGIEATSLIDGSWKMILRRQSGNEHFPELYSRQEDRQERQNLAPEMEILARYLVRRLAEIEEVTGDPLGKETISEEDLLEVEEQLRALGYIE